MTLGARTRVWLLLAVVLVGVAIGLVVGGGGYRAPVYGIRDAGPVVGWLLPFVRAVGVAAAAASFGWLLYAAFLGPQKSGGLLGGPARDDVRRASNAALVWAIASLISAWLNFSNVLGISAQEALRPQLIATYAWDITTVRAFLLSGFIALAIWVGARASESLAAAAGWAVLAGGALSLVPLAGHAAGLGNHGLALASGVLHSLSASAWVGGLLALAVHAWRRESGVAEAARRFSTLALVCVAALAVTGVVNALTRMNSPGELFTTGYGRVVLLKIISLLALIAIAAVVRRGLRPAGDQDRRRFALLVGVELSVMAVAMGLAVALTRTPYPKVAAEATTLAESLLGRPIPGAPTSSSVILGFSFEPVMLTGSLIAAALYVAGVMRLHGRGDSWPWLRTVSWMCGIGAVIWATNSGLGLYSEVSFSMHMIQHMTLSMLAPILLVVGTPITLALRAFKPAPGGRRGPREWIVWAIGSPVARFVTHPLWVLFIFTVGLYGLYYTSLFGTLMGSHLGHVVMQVHFLLAGYLFAYVVLGLDPAPRTLPPWVRLGMVLVAMVLHSFFAVPIMMSDSAFGLEYYSQVQPPWLTDQVADTKVAGGIAWGIAEVPTLLLLLVLGIQWAQSDDREAKRRDRRVDRSGSDSELDAYNERLARMNAAAKQRGE